MSLSMRMENLRRVGNLGHFKSLGMVAWSLNSSTGIMAKNHQSHLVKFWVSFPP